MDGYMSYYNLNGLIRAVPTNWAPVLLNIYEQKCPDIEDQLNKQYNKYHTKAQIFPPRELIFNAFSQSDLNETQVIVLGQDPYIGVGEAMGLSFSVPKGVTIPPSLRNIYTEIRSDENVEMSREDGDLTPWARQGVLLLNASLTVIEKKSGSHTDIWEKYTDEIIKYISENLDNCVFILWGNYAKSKKQYIDEDKHCVITGVHPSPLSASRGFFGKKYFSECNTYLKAHGKIEINWQIPPVVTASVSP